jgi:hypothetical protein
MEQNGASHVLSNTCFIGKLSFIKCQIIVEFLFRCSNSGKLKQRTQQVAIIQFSMFISTLKRIWNATKLSAICSILSHLSSKSFKSRTLMIRN